jgi:hypothetical protein
MVELVVCAFLLSAVAAVVGPGIRAVFEQRKKTRYDALAAVELNNLQVQLQSNSLANELALSAWFTKRFPTAKLDVSQLTDTEAEPGQEAFRLQISRTEGNSEPIARLQLVVWIASRGESE